MGTKLRETTNLCVEIMNSERQVYEKLAWSRDTNSGMPFDVNVKLKVSIIVCEAGPTPLF